ncbi:hypothetical protein A2T55_16345 [Brevibacterium linens]|uniref:O-antigen ligase-related domain-containing protein n=1 Tax=Brevibacterium linens TaxID=1703 RepID=A0A144MIJ8_BRELN|nr:hypothetical protein A2T55_16345 [Brevibacterium linens]
MGSVSVWGGSLRWSSAFAVLLVSVAALPLGLLFSVGPLDFIHVIVSVAIVVSALSRIGFGTAPWRWHPSATWLFALLIIYLASMVTARDQLIAAHTILISVLGGLLALTVHSICDSAARWRILLTVLVAVGSLVAVYGFATGGAVQTQAAGAGALSGRAVGVFTDPNQLGTFSAAMMMVAWGLALGTRIWQLRSLAIACAVLSAMSLIVSFSRGAWLGALAGTVVLIVVTVKYHRKMSLQILVFTAAVGIPVSLAAAPQIVTLVSERLSSILEPGSNPNDNRPFIYREAFRQVLQHPLLGQGPGNFPATSQLAERIGTAVEAVHAHNLLLQVASEAGLIAVAVLIAFVAGLARRTQRAWTMLPRSEAVVVLGLACALLSVLVQGIVDYTLGNPILYYLVWAIIGALFAVTQRVETMSKSLTSERTMQ